MHDRILIAKKLLSIARELSQSRSARAPQMGTPPWRDIRKGQTFMYKKKKWKKMTNSKAVEIVEPKVMYVRDNILD